MLYVMINPANILPMAKRLMGFISLGLFSFSVIRVGSEVLILEQRR